MHDNRIAVGDAVVVGVEGLDEIGVRVSIRREAIDDRRCARVGRQHSATLVGRRRAQDEVVIGGGRPR